MNDNEFFREATLRICGNLEIEKAIVSFLQYVKELLPADRLFLAFYDKNESALRAIVDATPEKGERVDVIAPISNESREFLKKKFGKGFPPPYYYDKPREVPVARELLDHFKQAAESILVLPLGTSELPLGIATFISEHTNYNDNHLKLAFLLKEPFQIALSNALKHRNELRLFDRDFFFEVTRRICGNLEIEEGLRDCIKYISQFLPVDFLYLSKYEKDQGINRLIAYACPEKCEKMDLLLPASEETKGAMSKNFQAWQDGTLPPVIVVNRPNEEIVTQSHMEMLGLPPCSTMNLPLVVQGELAGHLILLAEGDDRFEEQHSKLFATLRIPFYVAMSNALKHRNELRLFDRDFFFEVTRRICGNLEIEEGLHACIQYISEFMPADRMYLQRYQPDLDSMHLIARADKGHNEKMDKLVPFTKEAKNKLAELAKVWSEGKLPPILVINDPADEPVTKCMLEALNEPMSSALSLPLVVGNTLIGTLVLLAEGNNRYSEENAELFKTLKLPFFVALSNTLKHREVANLKELLADDNRYLRGELRRISGDEIIGANFGLKDTMYKVQQVARLDSPVLLLGETGVGKDVIANAIHYSSSRASGPFVKVNCGAIPDTLIDSELFGHEKGAFTGALAQKRGRFERADTGTIFLDEIGELPLQAQVRLLTVLQSKEIERVGGVKTIPLNIRIIAATNRNLEAMVKEQTFREDLWFRLNVFPVWIPPLRERLSDIPALLHHFIMQKSKELKLPDIPIVMPEATEMLMSYSWPGNVRELQNVVERELILNPSGPLDFQQSILPAVNSTRVPFDHAAGPDNLDEMTRQHIRRVLSKAGGKVHGSGGAAELLGVNANTLRNRMNKLGIQYKKNNSNVKGF